MAYCYLQIQTWHTLHCSFRLVPRWRGGEGERGRGGEGERGRGGEGRVGERGRGEGGGTQVYLHVIMSMVRPNF